MQWLKKAGPADVTEALIIAARGERARERQKPGQPAPPQDPGSKEPPETIQHVTAVCSMPVGEEDVERHNQVAGSVQEHLHPVWTGSSEVKGQRGVDKRQKRAGATAVVATKNSNIGRIGREAEQDVKISAIPEGFRAFGAPADPRNK